LEFRGANLMEVGFSFGEPGDFIPSAPFSSG
jgi:hypothetical protein